MKKDHHRRKYQALVRSAAIPPTRIGPIWVAVIAALMVALALLITASFASAAHKPFPDLIPLPDGFAPEGIATGKGTDFYAGSLATGAVFRGDLRSGEGEVLVPPQPGRTSVGLWVDERTHYIYVAGGGTGQGYVYNAGTGAEVAVFDLTAPGTFVNDVVVTREAAYFTDSFRPFLYRVSLSADGQPDPSSFTEIELTGDFSMSAGFNTNGIDATPNGKSLVIVNSAQGALYTVNPRTGEAILVDLGGDAVPNGDGILLDGKTLYVVQNFLNQIAVVALSPDLTSGEVVDIITDDDFDIPTTVAEFGSDLYAVNARFTTPVTPATEYHVVKVSK